MLTIWGRNTSSNVMKVLWLCDELGIAYRREDAGGAFGRTTEDFYRAMNPNPTVPTIVDTDGYTLWESNVILRYLCATRGGERLFPADPRARGDVERWVDWQQTSHNPQMSTMFLGLIRTPPEKRDMAAIEAARVQTAGLNDMLEQQLDGRDYLAGDFSIADIALGPQIHRWFALPIERPHQPRLRAWYDRLLSHPGYAKHCAGGLA